MSRGDAPAKVLDAAEQLFAARGFHGVSLRQVAQEAGVVVSLVVYHYPTKQALFSAVLGRRIATINHERLARLDKAMQEHGAGGLVDLEAVLRAFIEPAVAYARDKRHGGPQYAQLIAGVSHDPQPHAREVAAQHTNPIARHTIRALQMALPALDAETVARCYLFTVGAMLSAISPTGRLDALLDAPAPARSTPEVVDQLIAFLRGGFEAIGARQGATQTSAPGSKPRAPGAARPRRQSKSTVAAS